MKAAVTSQAHALLEWRGIPIEIAATSEGIHALRPVQAPQPPWPATPSPDASHPWFVQALACLDDPHLAPPPLAPHGTRFQLAVWAALRAIPRGHTRHYAAIAASIGHPAAARAVAAACAANPIAILIPCHRVVRRDGNLAGYRWGLDLKGFLLGLEQGHATPASPGRKKIAGIGKKVLTPRFVPR